MATLIMKTKKTFHLRQELQLVCNRREFSLLTIPLFSPLYLQRTITAFSSAHSQPFVWYLIAKSGAGEGRKGDGDKGALELMPSLTIQHFPARAACSLAHEELVPLVQSSSRPVTAVLLQPLCTDVK